MAEHEVTVRPVAVGDHDGWARLFHAYGVFYESELGDDVLAAVWGWLLDDGDELLGLVAELDGALVGFAHARTLRDTFTGGTQLYLEDLYTDPDARGHGVATALIAELQRRSDAVPGSKVRWITAADNATAQRVYDRVARRTTWLMYETGEED